MDQFEELFTLCADADLRRTFIEALLALKGPVVIGMRADMYGRLGGYPELARAVAANHVLLGAMSDDELDRAVKEPARLAGLRLEPGLVELALRDVADEPGALPLLSTRCAPRGSDAMAAHSRSRATARRAVSRRRSPGRRTACSPRCRRTSAR